MSSHALGWRHENAPRFRYKIPDHNQYAPRCHRPLSLLRFLLMPSRPPVVVVTPDFPENDQRLATIRRLAWLLDRSIPIGGGRRIGLDPLIGLIPGLGDWLGALISIFVVYQAIRLGLPLPVLVRMGLNIGIEALVGAVPVLGDLFDAAWQANHRNLKLVERHYVPGRRPRSVRGLLIAFAVVVVLFLAALAALTVAVVSLVWRLVSAL